MGRGCPAAGVRDGHLRGTLSRPATQRQRSGFVIRYDVAGREFLQIDRWFDLQGKWGQRRTYPSRYPAPPGWTGDWVTAGADEDEVRAPGAQDARDVPPPVALSSPPSFALSIPGLVDATQRGEQPERVGQLLERAKRGLLTEAEALELGTAIAIDEQSGERIRG